MQALRGAGGNFSYARAHVFDAVGIISSRLCFDSGFGRVIAARDEGRKNYFCRIHRDGNLG